MENTYKELQTDMELLTAALMQVHVYVVATSDKLVEDGGMIEAYSSLSVRIGSAWYLRQYNSFRVDV